MVERERPGWEREARLGERESDRQIIPVLNQYELHAFRSQPTAEGCQAGILV